MRRFYAPKENFSPGKITLGLEETRHLRDVLRLRAGEQVSVFDGEGREFSGVLETVSKKESVVRITAETAPAAPESNLDLTLAVALLKGEKFELVIQKAVELGVTRLVPLNTRRADVKLTDAAKKLERWRKIALEACKQSGRARLMPVDAPVDFEEFSRAAEGPRVLFAERGGEGFAALEPAKKITALVGSEGGWETSEIEAATALGFRIVTLAGRILRAETAAVAVAAILQHDFGDLR